MNPDKNPQPLPPDSPGKRPKNIPVTVTMRPDQRADFDALGGSEWLRRMIDKATGKL